MNWLAQLHGSSSIELRPKFPCDSTCSKLKDITLNKGELSMIYKFYYINFVKSVDFLVIYSQLYDALYTPLKKETIMLGQGVD